MYMFHWKYSYPHRDIRDLQKIKKHGTPKGMQVFSKRSQRKGCLQSAWKGIPNNEFKETQRNIREYRQTNKTLKSERQFTIWMSNLTKRYYKKESDTNRGDKNCD